MSHLSFKQLSLLLIWATLLCPHLLRATDPADDGPQPTNETSESPMAGAPWSAFNDPVLNELVARALAGNPGIAAASARIDQAEAVAKASLAPLRPKVFAEAGYIVKDFDATSTGSASQLLSFLNPDEMDPVVAEQVGVDVNLLRAIQSAPPPEFPNYMQSLSASLTAQYDFDISSRYRKARAGALHNVSAAREDVQAHGMTIASLVVQTYYDIAAAKLRVQLIEEQIENNETLLKLVMAQFEVGSASSLDVLQQRGQLASKKAQLPHAKTIIESGKLQLAALLNEPPEKLPEIPAALPSLSKSPHIPNDANLNRRLMNNRPELRAAKLRIKSLELQAESTKRALYPSLALMGRVGYGWSRINEWDGDEAWQVGATFTVPIYMGGANRVGIQQAEAATLNARYTLENSVLQSRAKVLAAKEREKAATEYLAALKLQIEASELTVKEATRKYLAGLSSYLNVLNASDVLQRNQLTLIQAERDLVSARTDLLEALGGEWTRRLVEEGME